MSTISLQAAAAVFSKNKDWLENLAYHENKQF